MSSGGEEGGGLLVIAAVCFGIWYMVGDPGRTIAGWFYPEDAAPWETVDAFYYPNSNNLSVHESAHGLDDMSACRRWAIGRAAAHNDPALMRSDYECGIGTPKDMYGMNVYRATAD